MLYDQDFLLQLDKIKNKIVHVRITALTFQEQPIETIEGRATQGSINVDGSSAVRRTCSLTMVAEGFNYLNYYWGVNTKFKLEIGLENHINPNYPDVIWFNQGIYIFTSFNTSRATNNFTITLQGKDKMCLLNGEVGGALESSVDFGTIEEESEDGIWTIRKIPIRDIIWNAVHTYAGEPFHNIIINDLDDYGLELLEYRYDLPLYLYRQANSQLFDNILLNGDTECYVVEDFREIDEVKFPIYRTTTLKLLEAKDLDLLVDTLHGTENPSLIMFEKPKEPEKEDEEPFIPPYFHIAKVEYGQTAGYRITDLVYAGDLIANVGEAVTSVLDKIKNMLSEFEYFYNVEGQFVFQKKKSFINTFWTPTLKGDTEYIDENGDSIFYSEKYIESLAYSTNSAYTFNEGELISAFNNTPNILNMRNDFSIWGVRKGTSGADLPVHLRYAIDVKPKYYKNYQGRIFISDELNLDDYVGEWVSQVDWREIIFQMSKDYYQHHTEDDYSLKIIENNLEYYPNGVTGYERYYTDLEGFWRQLYNPFFDEEINELEDKKTAKEDEALDFKSTIDDSSASAIDKQVAQTNLETINKRIEILDFRINELVKNQENYYSPDDNEKNKYWNKDVYERPHLLNFWFDFLDSEGELSQFNVRAVGDRTKSVNETTVKSIYFRETPDVIFVDENHKKEDFITGYKYVQIQDIDTMFSLSAQGKSAKDRLDELIYQHGYCIETATITTIPIYYLQPNTRIHLTDQETNLNGDYIINRITIPLNYNGTMQITATKAAENII